MRFAIVLLASILLLNWPSHAAEPTLKQVMQGLNRSMDLLNKGIFYTDFKLIAQAAKQITNHPKPKGQLSTIVGALGFKMFSFKKYDGKVNDPAGEIITLAAQKKMPQILAKQAQIIQNCVACHQEYRATISKALQKK